MCLSYLCNVIGNTLHGRYDETDFNITLAFLLATETEGRRRMISKGFYHQLKNHEKQPLVGTTSNVVIYLSKLSPSYRSS